jgi:hypothetical protein
MGNRTGASAAGLIVEARGRKNQRGRAEERVDAGAGQQQDGHEEKPPSHRSPIPAVHQSPDASTGAPPPRVGLAGFEPATS